MATDSRRTVIVRQRGMTLVELLVVIAILALLMALLLPAVQSARESARRVQCLNNLRQLALAANSHVASQGHFPSNGWGFRWTGEPDRGFGEEQPGGWLYNLLPWLEQESVRMLGAGLVGDAKRTALLAQRTSVIPLFYCPSRRAPRLYPASESAFNSADNGRAAKTDYAACNGSRLTNGTANAQCIAEFPNCRGWNRNPFDGITGVLSRVTPAHVRDGLAHTLFAAEKHVSPDLYLGSHGADNNSCFQGNDWDVNRWVGRNLPPLQDLPGYAGQAQFGSAHATSLHAAACDGSVHVVAYGIDPAVWESLGRRNDGGEATW